MTEYLIHIGLHKTATTFLQEMLFPKLEETTLITRPYTQHNHAFNKLQYADDTLYDKAELLAELERIEGDRILISDESLSGKVLTFNYINRSMIARRLKEAIPQATILVFIRGQVDILRSMYNQYVRTGGTKKMENLFWAGRKNYTLDMYLKKDREQLYGLETLYYNTNGCYVHLDDYLYYEPLALYYHMFNRVEVFLYEDLVSKPEECARRISEIFGLKEEIPLACLGSGNRVNRSVEEEALNELRFLNTIRSVTSKRRHIDLARKIYRCFLKRREIRCGSSKVQIEKMIGGYYKANNAKLAREFPHVGIQNHPQFYKI